MASSKAKLLEQSLQDEMHPFAARMGTPPPQPEIQETKQPSNQARQETLKRTKAQPRISSNAIALKRVLADTSFDINRQAVVSRGFYFTQEELEAIEDLKLELKRNLDLKITQYDILRIGVHAIVEDYRKNGEDSIVVRRAKKKLPK